MPDSFGPVYEVTHTVDPEVIEDFDVWLGQHIGEMLSISGLSRAASFTAGDHEDGRPVRVTQYHFDSDADLENYLAGPAELMRRTADEKFAGHFEVSRKALHESDFVDGSLRAAKMCLNCGSTLSGQYCGNCGQRAGTRLISIWQLLREAFGDLLELDSRLWRTLIPLTIRPGQLTRDYLEGRRARFMPPFRTYLVLSIVFFLVAFFDPKEEFGILFATEADVPEDTAPAPADADEIRSEVMRQLAEDGVLPAEQAGIAPQPEEDVPGQPLPEQDTGTKDEPAVEEDKKDAFNIQINDGKSSTTGNCDDIETEGWPEWLETRLTPARLKVACQRVVADNGTAFLSKLLDSVPAALIALLPIMALVLKALYPLSKRYYVEHVLFVVHYHAFVFLILSVQIMFSRLVSLLSLPESIPVITSVAVSLYILVYLFKAMRRVYEQGWFFTMLKNLVLLSAYFAGMIVILVATAIIAAFSI